MPLFNIWMKPLEDLVISVKIDAKDLAEALEKGKKLDTKKQLLAKGLEWIDGGFYVSGVHEND